MNTTLLLFLLIPAIGSAVLYTIIKGKDGLIVGGVSFLIGCLVVGGAFALSHGAATADVEIWNGQVVDKSREHGTYEESYSCNCRQVCTGSGQQRSCSQQCDTCYRTHYTVTWACNTTVGPFEIAKKDELSKSVYNSPDPWRWQNIKKGDPVAKAHPYTNYVQAVPNALFTQYADDKTFDALIPPYPDNVYDIYKVDHFLSPGFNFTDRQAWNDDMAMMLRDLGPRKQVNAIVVIAKTPNQRYALALQDKWEGANKNDVVLVIGSLDGRTIEWVHVISWTKRELFKVQLRDDITDLKIIDRSQIIPILQKNIADGFERRKMSEFQYLSDSIDPPTWVLVALTVLLIVGYGVFWLYWQKNAGRYRGFKY